MTIIMLPLFIRGVPTVRPELLMGCVLMEIYKFLFRYENLQDTSLYPS